MICQLFDSCNHVVTEFLGTADSCNICRSEVMLSLLALQTILTDVTMW
jgi:hypothetical protein